MEKLPNECLFCKNRFCYHRVYRKDEPSYNEIACRKHVDDLHEHVDKILGKGKGVMRTYENGTGLKSRNQEMV